VAVTSKLLVTAVDWTDPLSAANGNWKPLGLILEENKVFTLFKKV